MLLDNGADVNAQSGEYGNALYAASSPRLSTSECTESYAATTEVRGTSIASRHSGTEG